MLFPDYIFEASWEVCNKVGGIYTVLSTRAKTLQERIKDHVVFLGPDCWSDSECPFFREDENVFPTWQKEARKGGLEIKAGRWLVPGEPIAILVGFKSYFAEKDSIYGKLWNDYQIDSLHAYGDYDDSLMFSYAAGKVVENLYKSVIKPEEKVVFHVNEWQTAAAALYVKKTIPQIGTIFTTHATGIGRSIAGNDKPLYDYLWAYNGDQMAEELNMQSKHSVEKQSAHNVDCFTTVSDITARECSELLDRPVDYVLPNGFENDFVPKGVSFNAKRRSARNLLLRVANALTGDHLDDNSLIISTSGRYEFRNKGIDLFIDTLGKLSYDTNLKKNVVAFIEVPGWVKEPRKDLQERLESAAEYDTPLPNSILTHHLNDEDNDRIVSMLRRLDLNNERGSKVKVIFVPCYLIGDDGIFNKPYYDIILGNDLCIYPSYYEPWGYTPLESVAFKVPCITTDLAGFGLWANSEKTGKKTGQIAVYSTIEDGVEVVHRTDNNYWDVVDHVGHVISKYASFSDETVKSCRDNAFRLSKKALWSNFFKYYEKAYDFALAKAAERMKGTAEQTK